MRLWQRRALATLALAALLGAAAGAWLLRAGADLEAFWAALDRAAGGDARALLRAEACARAFYQHGRVPAAQDLRLAYGPEDGGEYAATRDLLELARAEGGLEPSLARVGARCTVDLDYLDLPNRGRCVQAWARYRDAAGGRGETVGLLCRVPRAEGPPGLLTVWSRPEDGR